MPFFGFVIFVFVSLLSAICSKEKEKVNNDELCLLLKKEWDYLSVFYIIRRLLISNLLVVDSYLMVFNDFRPFLQKNSNSKKTYEKVIIL